jgi:hypothetical protein
LRRTLRPKSAVPGSLRLCCVSVWLHQAYNASYQALRKSLPRQHCYIPSVSKQAQNLQLFTRVGSRHPRPYNLGITSIPDKYTVNENCLNTREATVNEMIAAETAAEIPLSCHRHVSSCLSPHEQGRSRSQLKSDLTVSPMSTIRRSSFSSSAIFGTSIWRHKYSNYISRSF